MSKPREKVPYVGLVDCNNFFVSCERLFRPDLRGKPVLVLSANDGCVISRSKEVKELGIPMGVPHFEIRDRIARDGITIFSSNFTLYRDISMRVMATVRSVAGDAEVYSIDEAFFAVPQSDALVLAQDIKQKVEQWVGIPVSIGIADTKTLAKHMGAYAKTHGGIAIISQGAREALLETSLHEIWGVGRKTYDKLKQQGITTVGDVVTLGPVRMRTHLGILGEQLFYELSGVTRTHEKQRGHHQSIMSSASFGIKIKRLSDVEDALSYHIAQVAEKARKDTAVAHLVSFSLRYEDSDGAVRVQQGQLALIPPTADTRKITQVVLAVVRPTWNAAFRYKKVGVVLSHLIPEDTATGSLFEPEDSRERVDSLMQTFDAINAKHGRGSVRMATEKKTHAWKGKSVFVSQAYTTSWTSLPDVPLH